MIQLTRLNKELLVVNSDLIKFVECAPDTVLTLVTGEKLVVRESLDEVLRRIIAFRHSILVALPQIVSEYSGQNPPSKTVIDGGEK